jgi:putative transposase
MSRPLRIEFAGALYHVTSRGDGKDNIYLQDSDRELFLNVLENVIKRFNWALHAYCLMDNHYHLLVETPDGNLSKGMRHLNGVYTQRFNHEHGRVGHVFQGRYKAILVQKESYLLELARYIVLNPVRAGMVKEPKDWYWSSYRNTAGMEEAPHWLHVDWILSFFSERRQEAIKPYKVFVAEGNDQPTVWEQLKNQIYLGSELFVDEMQCKLSVDFKSTEIPYIQRRQIAKPLDGYMKKYTDRNLAILKAYESGHYSMQEIGSFFGLHYTSISRIVNRLGNAQ